MNESNEEPLMHKDLTPDLIGIYISSDKAPADPKAKVGKKEKRSYDKYSFSSEQDLIDFIMENAADDDIIMIYSYDKEGIIELNWFGNKMDLAN